MAKAKYIGDPNDNFSGPITLTAFGIVFPRDKWVPVNDLEVATKLFKNTHFEVDMGGGEKSVTPDPLPARSVTETEVRSPADRPQEEMGFLRKRAEELGIFLEDKWDAARIAAEIQSVESKTDAARDSLLKEAEALGLKVDGRWSTPRLQAEIDAKKAG